MSKNQIDFSTLSTYCSTILSEVNRNTSCSDLDVLHRETGFGPSDLPRHLQEVLDLSIFSIRPSKTKLPPLIDYWNIPSPRKNGNFEGGNSPWKGKHVPSKSLVGLSSTPKMVARRTQSGNVAKMGRKSGIERKLNPIVASSLPTNRGKSLSGPKLLQIVGLPRNRLTVAGDLMTIESLFSSCKCLLLSKPFPRSYPIIKREVRIS